MTWLFDSSIDLNESIKQRNFDMDCYNELHTNKSDVHKKWKFPNEIISILDRIHTETKNTQQSLVPTKSQWERIKKWDELTIQSQLECYKNAHLS